MIIVFGMIFAIMYFLMIRPQQRRDKEHKKMLSAIEKGDAVALMNTAPGEGIGETGYPSHKTTESDRSFIRDDGRLVGVGSPDGPKHGRKARTRIGGCVPIRLFRCHV